MSYQIAVRSGDPAARLLATRRLQAKFPQSPEYAIVAAAGSTTARDSANVSLMALARKVFGRISIPRASILFACTCRRLHGPTRGADACRGDCRRHDSPGRCHHSRGRAFLRRGPGSQAALDSATSTAPPTSQKTLSVQAGSFQMKENADDLISELTKKGFSPTLRIDALEGSAPGTQGSAPGTQGSAPGTQGSASGTQGSAPGTQGSAPGTQGKSLYRVFAGTGLAVDEARALLDKLHEAGFSGFLLNDQ